MTTCVNLIGLAAGALTTISFMPQVIKTWKTKSCRDISVVMFALFAIGVSLWIVYGAITGSWPLIVANAATLILVLIILFFKIKYK